MRKEKTLAGILIILALFLYVLGIYIPSHIGADRRLFVSFIWIIFILVYRFKIPKLTIKERQSVRNQIALLAFNIGVVTIITSIIGGMLLGFGKNAASRSLIGIISNLLYMIIVLIGREIIRSYTLCSCKKKNRIGSIVLVTLFFSLTEMNMARISQLEDMKDIIITFVEYMAPIMCKNLLATTLVMYSGAKASIIYLGMISAFEWIAPILPNLPWIGTGVIGMIIPVIGVAIVNENYKKMKRQIKIREIKKESVLSYVAPSIIIVASIWFMVGVFPYYPSAIMTGSMKPMIQPGDVVIIDKIESLEEMKALKVGDVIQFERNDLMINHRIIEITEVDGQTLYQTKGDNNNVADTPLVEMKDIRGRIIQVVPKVGWPSVWLHTGG